jgi:FkbM family methyltransferase
MEVAVTYNGILYPIHLRLRTTDISLFEEIIVNPEYEFESGREPAVIIDAGANIGLTSVYFANRYPQAKIISIEPETSNYSMLTKNTAAYPNIVPIQAALWKTDTFVALNDPGSGNWGFQTGESKGSATPGSTVRGLTIDTLMREQSVDYIDVLKVDIEGSEKEVFESYVSWIDRIGILIVELHDRWKSGCSQNVYTAAKGFPVKWTRGETTYFFRSEYCPPQSRSTTLALSTDTKRPTRPLARSRILTVQS